jgi:hypothetical protein
MPDSYLAISAIANDDWMNERLNACATQQAHLGNAPGVLSVGNPGDPLLWVQINRYLWASSPSWGEKWDYALASNSDNPEYEPGKDVAVITDEDILATVQHLTNPTVEIPPEE